MSADRIQQLHEKASECYLSGDYRGALQAWRDVLGLDPANEQALGGVRLASQFVEPGVPAFAEAAPDVERELDRGLKVLDGFGASDLLHADHRDGSIDQKPEPEGHGAAASDGDLAGWDSPAEPTIEEGSFGLEPVSGSSPDPAPAPTASAAAAELERRVNDLLAEAKAKADAGERDEALSILARLSILDEDNAQAQALRVAIEAADASDLDKVERAIIEGVAALEAGKLDAAEGYFREALELAPEHREAQHYLETVEKRRSSGGDDLLGSVRGESAPADDAVPLATGIDKKPRQQPSAPKSPRTAPPPPSASPEPPSSKGPRFALPPPKVLIVGGVAAVVLVCAAIALPRLFGGSEPGTSAPVPRPARGAKAGGVPKAAAQPAGAPAAPAGQGTTLASSLAAGRSLMESGDFAGAVLAFNEALKLEPGNEAAKAGLSEAGVAYKADKIQREAINGITLAFRDGEFTSGLRLAYRLPPGVKKSYADAIKVVGWYNLAVVALRAGDCREALAHLGEALEIAPADAEANKLREFAARYAESVRDRVFLDRVEALEFRPLPSP